MARLDSSSRWRDLFGFSQRPVLSSIDPVLGCCPSLDPRVISLPSWFLTIKWDANVFCLWLRERSRNWFLLRPASLVMSVAGFRNRIVFCVRISPRKRLLLRSITGLNQSIFQIGTDVRRQSCLIQMVKGFCAPRLIRRPRIVEFMKDGHSIARSIPSPSCGMLTTTPCSLGGIRNVPG